MSFSSIIAPLRQTARIAIRPRPHAIRSMHASSSVLKKKATAISEDAFEEDEEDDLDLFDDVPTPTTSTPLPTDANAILRSKLIDEIKDLAGLSPRRARGQAGQIKKSMVSRVIGLTENKEDLEGLENILRSWRFLGLQVGDNAMSSLVDRCCKLGRPELVLELYSQPTQYGITNMSSYLFNKTHRSITQMASPPASLPKFYPPREYTINNALWRLAALSHVSTHAPQAEAAEAGGAEPVATRGKDAPSDIDAFVQELDSVRLVSESTDEIKPDIKARMDAQLREAVEKVRARGGEWEGAVKKVEGIAEKLKGKERRRVNIV